MGRSASQSGWLWCELNELLVPVGTTTNEDLSVAVTYIEISAIDSETKQVRSPRTLLSAALPTRARYIVRPGDVLFGLVRPYLKAIAAAPDLPNMVASSAISVLRPIQGVSSRFVFYLVQSDRYLDALLPLQRGASYPAVTDSDVKKQRVLLPPAEEQIRIAQELDFRLQQLAGELEVAKAAQEACTTRRQALYDRTLSSPPLVSVDQGVRLQDAWRREPLGALLTLASYGTSMRTSFSAQGSPVLRIPNVTQGEIRYEPLHYTFEPLDIGEKEQLKIGDILVIRSNGSIGLVGLAAAFRGLPVDGVYFASYLIRLRVDDRKVSPAWVEAYFASTAAREWITGRSIGTTTQHNVNLKTIRSMVITVPPRSQQDDLLRQLDAGLRVLEVEWGTAQGVINRVEKDRQELLNDAVTGALMPFTAGGTSAKDLLEAGRMERAAAAALEDRKRRETRVKRKTARPMGSSGIESVMSRAWLSGDAAYSIWLGGQEHSVASVEQFFHELNHALVSRRLESRILRDGAGAKVGDEIRLSGGREGSS